MSKKKLHFYQLTLIFSSIVTIVLLNNWGYNGSTQKNASMMSQSMGKMMSEMHLKNIKLGDLIYGEQQNTTNIDSMHGDNTSVSVGANASGSSNTNTNTANHHESSSNFLKVSNLLSTATIIVLIPFIIAGTIFLMIIWMK